MRPPCLTRPLKREASHSPSAMGLVRVSLRTPSSDAIVPASHLPPLAPFRIAESLIHASPARRLPCPFSNTHTTRFGRAHHTHIHTHITCCPCERESRSHRRCSLGSHSTSVCLCVDTLCVCTSVCLCAALTRLSDRPPAHWPCVCACVCVCVCVCTHTHRR